MKTLKQFFKEFSDRPEEPEIGVIYTSITNKEFQEIVKEWLTQKRQEGAIGLIAKEAQRNYNMVIDELLDSLESPTGEELQEE